MALLIGGVLLAQSEGGRAAEASGSVSLSGYLKQLGYEGLDFEATGRSPMRIDGLLSNGRKPRLLIDTGWGVSALDPSYAKGLKSLEDLGGTLQDPVLGTVTNKDLVLMDKLVLGGVAKFSNQPARVRELKADYTVVQWDGVLGLDFLIRNSCLIDCWEHRLYVRASSLSQEHAEVMDQSLRLAGFTEVNLQRKGFLDVEAEINGHPVLLLVDTGAPFNLLDNSQVQHLGLNIVRYSRPATGSFIEREAGVSVVGMGDIGLQHMKIAKLDTLRLGQRQLKGVYFGVGDLKAWGLGGSGARHEEIKGWLSKSFLGMQGALIDVSRGKLWLRQSKPTAEH